MTLGQFDTLCRRCPAALRVIQWHGSHVWKIGARVFAIGNDHAGTGMVSITVKATPLAYTMLMEQGLATRAPHLPRGHWLRLQGGDEALIAGLIRDSHRLIAAMLPRSERERLHLAGSGPDRRDDKEDADAQRTASAGDPVPRGPAVRAGRRTRR